MPENKYGKFRAFSCSLKKDEFIKMLENRLPEDGAVNISVFGPHLDQFSFKIYEKHELGLLPPTGICVQPLKEGVVEEE